MAFLVASGMVLAIVFLVARARGWLMPAWVTFDDDRLSVDLDQDGSDELVELCSGSLMVATEDGSALYATPHAWKIAFVQAFDVNDDGLPELVMLAWRRGNYGTSRPFWDTGIDLRMTEHLYVMGMREGEFRPVWMGHELGREVTSLAFSPDSHILTLIERDGTTSSWVWERFGFVAA